MFRTVEEHLKLFDLEGKLSAALATDSTIPLFRASEMFSKQATTRKAGELLPITVSSSQPKDDVRMETVFKDSSYWFFSFSRIFAGKIKPITRLLVNAVGLCQRFEHIVIVRARALANIWLKMSFVRIRLTFQHSLPHTELKNCWFLVDTSSCNTVADLEYLIRKRFKAPSKSCYAVKLFLDDFLLPSQEKIEIIQNNDHIRCLYP